MASAADPPATTAQSNTPAVSASRTESAQEVSSTTPVEMETLAPPGAASSTTDTTAQASDPATATATATATAPATIAVPHTTATIPATESQAAAAKAALPSNLTRTETEAIGPSIDTLAAQPDHTDGPVLVITLLLTSGARHPYRIDERYLKRRNVTVDEMNPYNITVYTLKELIWRDWRSEWEPRPTNHSSIRLISFGRMLDDKAQLKDCRFMSDSPNVVHMTVKPQDIVDEEDAQGVKGATRRANDEERTVGCRCVIL